MKVKDIMTSSPCCCSPTDSLGDVARIMRDNDCGAVPVVENGCVVGIVTDRDLAVRGLADRLNADARVGDVITRDPRCCSPDDCVRDVEIIMAENQIRRVPVVDQDGCCIGIVSQADLARAVLEGQQVSEHEVAIVVERISEPPRRRFDRGAGDTLEQRL